MVCLSRIPAPSAMQSAPWPSGNVCAMSEECVNAQMNEPMDNQDHHGKENSLLTDIKILFWSGFPTCKMEKINSFTVYFKSHGFYRL